MVFLVDMFSILVRAVYQSRVSWRMEEAPKNVAAVQVWATRRWKNQPHFGPYHYISDAIVPVNMIFLLYSKVDEKKKTVALSLLQVKLGRISPAKRGKGECSQLPCQRRRASAERLLFALHTLKMSLLVGMSTVSSA
jgi:hypothetical protein